MEIKQNLKAFGARLRTRWKLSTVLVAVVIYVADAIFSNSLTGNILPAIWRALVKWAARPTGVTGIVLALVVAAAVVWAAADPVGLWKRRKRYRPQLDPHELNEIEQIRAIWIGSGEYACQRAQNFVDACLHHFRHTGKSGFSMLLRYPQTELRDAVNRLVEALNVENRIPLSEVQERLDAVTKAYFKLTAWEMRALHLDSNIVGGTTGVISRVDVRYWEDSHRELASGLVSVRKRSANQAKIREGLHAELLDTRFMEDSFTLMLPNPSSEGPV